MIHAESISHKLTLLEHIREFWMNGCKCRVCQAVDRKEDILVQGRKG